MTELAVIQDEAGTASGCSCCATPAAEAVAAEPKETTVSTVSENVTTAVYTVSGMTCGHCVNSVTEEVGAIDGVRNVDVVLETGQVTVTSAAPLTVEAVQAAVDEAGYTLVH
ncbi:heavy-metal-associated domain-containing protein [Catenulispora rubra]|uniref:heavy-metal-associated domain-containing protein n=1 Tax=Catenulispora rubra TaxID=280293 RepID=UPI00189247D5|nr:cation transporter [Catenulispora rubra]